MEEKYNYTSIVQHVKDGGYHHLLTELKNGRFTQAELDESLDIATSLGDLQSTKILLSYGADTTYITESGTPLLFGITIGSHCDLLSLLLEYGYNVNHAIDALEETGSEIPLHISIWKKDLPMVKMLISSKFKTSYRDSEGNTALLVSCISGSEEMLSIILSSKCDVSVQNYKGENCLHLAAKHNHKHLVEKLLKHGADTNCENEFGDTPIFTAAKLELEEIVNFLLTYPDVNISHKNKDGSSLLHIIAPFADPNFLENYLGHGFRLFDVDNYGNNILNIAACFNNETLLISLLPKFQAVDINQAGLRGRTTLHWAVLNNMEASIDSVVNIPNINLDVKDDEGNTPLILAVKNNRHDTAKILLNHGANPHIGDISSWNALHWTCYRGYVHILASLFEFRCDISLVTNDSETCFIIAVKSNRTDILELLFRQHKSDEIIKIADGFGQTLLHHAVKNGQRDIVVFLLENGCMKLLDNKDKNTNSTISIAAEKGHMDIVKLLLGYNVKVNVLDEELKTPLFRAVKAEDFSTVKMLLNHGADPNIDVLSNCLIEACKMGHKDILKLLLDNGAIIDKTDLYERTAFMWASQKGHLDIMVDLLMKGANPTVIDRSGDTALTVAAFDGHEDVLKFLLPLSNLEHKEFEEGMPALLLALSSGHTDCAKILIENGADINVTAENGNTPLIVAAALDLGVDIIKQILSTGKLLDINAIGDQDRNAIHWAISDINALQLLLNSNYFVKLNETDENGATPLLLSIAHSLPDSAVALINAHCKIDVIHMDGREPIHHASIYGEENVLAHLLEKGISPFTLTSDNRSPLILASIEGHAPCVDILLKSGAKEMVNDVFFDAITPLSVAVNGSHYKTMEILLEAGAHPDLIGSKKSRPIIISILRDDSKSVKMLLQYGADIEEFSDLNNHPVTVAALKHRWDILSLMLELLTNTNIVRRILKGGAIYYFVLDEPVRLFLKNYVTAPTRLKKLCRTAVRNCISIPKKHNINNLSIGNLLKDYLLLDNL